MPAFRQALADTPGLEEVVGRRAKNRIAFRAASKTGASNEVAALNAEFKELGAKLDYLTANKPDAKQAVVDREKLLKAVGDNHDRQLPLMGVITARGDQVQLCQEIGGLIGRILLAVFIVLAIARRTLLRIF